MIWILCILVVYESVKLIRIVVSYLELKNSLHKSAIHTAAVILKNQQHHICLEKPKTKESFQRVIENKADISSADIIMAAENNYFSDKWYKVQRVIEIEKHLLQKIYPNSSIDELHNTIVDQVFIMYGRSTSIDVISYRVFEYKGPKESTSFSDHLTAVQKFVVKNRKTCEDVAIKIVMETKRKHLRTMIIDCLKVNVPLLSVCMRSRPFLTELYDGESPLMLWTTIAQALLPQNILANERARSNDMARSIAQQEANRKEAANQIPLQKILKITEKERLVIYKEIKVEHANHRFEMGVKAPSHSNSSRITKRSASKHPGSCPNMAMKRDTSEGGQAFTKMVLHNEDNIVLHRVSGCCDFCGSPDHKKYYCSEKLTRISDTSAENQRMMLRADIKNNKNTAHSLRDLRHNSSHIKSNISMVQSASFISEVEIVEIRGAVSPSGCSHSHVIMPLIDEPTVCKTSVGTVNDEVESDCFPVKLSESNDIVQCVNVLTELECANSDRSQCNLDPFPKTTNDDPATNDERMTCIVKLALALTEILVVSVNLTIALLGLMTAWIESLTVMTEKQFLPDSYQEGIGGDAKIIDVKSTGKDSAFASLTVSVGVPTGVIISCSVDSTSASFVQSSDHCQNDIDLIYTADDACFSEKELVSETEQYILLYPITGNSQHSEERGEKISIIPVTDCEIVAKSEDLAHMFCVAVTIAMFYCAMLEIAVQLNRSDKRSDIYNFNAISDNVSGDSNTISSNKECDGLEGRVMNVVDIEDVTETTLYRLQEMKGVDGVVGEGQVLNSEAELMVEGIVIPSPKQFLSIYQYGKGMIYLQGCVHSIRDATAQSVCSNLQHESRHSSGGNGVSSKEMDTCIGVEVQHMSLDKVVKEVIAAMIDFGQGEGLTTAVSLVSSSIVTDHSELRGVIYRKEMRGNFELFGIRGALRITDCVYNTSVDCLKKCENGLCLNLCNRIGMLQYC